MTATRSRRDVGVVSCLVATNIVTNQPNHLTCPIQFVCLQENFDSHYIKVAHYEILSKNSIAVASLSSSHVVVAEVVVKQFTGGIR